MNEMEGERYRHGFSGSSDYRTGVIDEIGDIQHKYTEYIDAAMRVPARDRDSLRSWW